MVTTDDFIRIGIKGILGITEDLFSPSNTHLNNNYLYPQHRVSYEFTKQSYLSINNRTNVQDYIYDKNLSSINIGIWHNHNKKISHISHRGSIDITDFLESDIQVLTNNEDVGNRFVEALLFTNKTREKYNYDIDISGHSLGGSIVIHICSILGDNSWFNQAITFNPIISPYRKKGSMTYNEKITHLRRYNDIITKYQPTFGRSIFYHDIKDPIQSHSIENWGTDNNADIIIGDVNINRILFSGINYLKKYII